MPSISTDILDLPGTASHRYTSAYANVAVKPKLFARILRRSTLCMKTRLSLLIDSRFWTSDLTTLIARYEEFHQAERVNAIPQRLRLHRRRSNPVLNSWIRWVTCSSFRRRLRYAHPCLTVPYTNRTLRRKWIICFSQPRTFGNRHHAKEYRSSWQRLSPMLLLRYSKGWNNGWRSYATALIPPSSRQNSSKCEKNWNLTEMMMEARIYSGQAKWKRYSHRGTYSYTWRTVHR